MRNIQSLFQASSFYSFYTPARRAKAYYIISSVRYILLMALKLFCFMFRIQPCGTFGLCFRTQHKFEKKMNNIFLAGGFRIENPSRNTLSSTAYFAKPRYGISLPRYAKSRSLLTTVKYKIDNNSKTKNCTEKTHEYNNFDHNIVHLLR